ncbi:hypothetical protein J8273_3632 [Carpediemonas membranifera]|uniref:Uncharacterized protein n=1 Tax=Carpediemonas membranifera TaxID=201153 RepID=A0A8J6EAG4_9EUKA|nr:hypothetical protein J8273_3632 [Carpediemonas membranifera]|eukprot:KAG9394660.1 hypothetical protein J8273_3632 [Carpediemonas membranifera]
MSTGISSETDLAAEILRIKEKHEMRLKFMRLTESEHDAITYLSPRSISKVTQEHQLTMDELEQLYNIPTPKVSTPPPPTVQQQPVSTQRSFINYHSAKFPPFMPEAAPISPRRHAPSLASPHSATGTAQTPAPSLYEPVKKESPRKELDRTNGVLSPGRPIPMSADSPMPRPIADMLRRPRGR